MSKNFDECQICSLSSPKRLNRNRQLDRVSTFCSENSKGGKVHFMQLCNLATLQLFLRNANAQRHRYGRRGGILPDVVNDAVKQLLAEGIEDIAAFDERANEPTLGFEDFVKALKERGKHIDTTITRPL